MRRWLPLIILAAAQFVMVLDSSVMNVSISQIVVDLDTTVTGVQGAITAYTLVMAAFMLVGAKLGDIWGRDRAFAIGLAVYGLGSLTTALSPNLYVPAVRLVAGGGPRRSARDPGHRRPRRRQLRGEGPRPRLRRDRRRRGAAIAVGPVIGGFVTTYYSWRYVFVGEVVIVIAILLVRRRMAAAPRPQNPPRLDVVGAALSAAGLGLIVLGILQSSKWGSLEPLDAPTIGGTEITPLGFSLVPFLIVGGICLLWLFGLWENGRGGSGRDALLERALLRIASLRAGLTTLLSQQLVLMGTSSCCRSTSRSLLGLDAFETGKRLLPMSVTMLIAALAGPKLSARLAPRLVVQIGLSAMVVAAVVLVGTIDVNLDESGFRVSLALFGVGAGLMMSQLGNVIMSSAPPEKTNEAGGLQGTARTSARRSGPLSSAPSCSVAS